MAEDNRLVWLDVETTGLDSETDRILEIGVVVTDEELNEVGDPLVLTVHQEEYVLERMNDWCKETHGQSGLVDAVRGASLRTGEVESNLIVWLKGMGFEPKSAVIAGYSIHFDRRFIARRMPDLHEFLHHRLFDVSTLRGAVARWFPEEHPVRQLAERSRDHDDDAHRALADIRAAIEECRRYANVFNVICEWSQSRTRH